MGYDKNKALDRALQNSKYKMKDAGIWSDKELVREIAQDAIDEYKRIKEQAD